jgi:hypothetical protein
MAARKPPTKLTGRYAPSEPQQFFRRVPGKRTYYNTRTGEVVTEHFVVRVYRPSRTAEEREQRLERSRRYGVAARRDRQTIWNAYQAKERHEGREASREDFNVWYQELNELRIERLRLRQSGTPRAWAAFNHYTGPFAQVAVELGIRDPNAAHPVTTSPKFHFRYA